MKALIVAKDMGSANVTYPVYELLYKHGHEVYSVTEGLASTLFSSRSLTDQVPFCPLFMGSTDFRTVPFTVDAGLLLENLGKLSVRPDVVVTGLGSPINLEQSIALAANKLGIPVVMIEDFWNGSCRSKAEAAIVATLDDSIAPVIEADRPDSEVIVAGNVGFPTKEKQAVLSSDHPARTFCSKLLYGFDSIIMYVGGGVSTEEEIGLLLLALEKTSGNWCLIFRPHPKIANLPDPTHENRPYGEVWQELLRHLGERLVMASEIKNTDALVPHVDIVVSGFSTLLTTAAAFETVVVSLRVPSVMESLQRQTKLLEVPHVTLGLAYSMEEPQDLSQFTKPSKESLGRVKSYDPLIVVSAIEKLVSGK